MPRLYRGYGKGFERFEHAIADSILSPGITLRELAMLEFVNQITDKPRWWEEVFDEVAIKAWRGECGSEEEQRYEATLLDRACFDYCIAELRDKAAYYQQHGVVSVLDVMAGVVKADLDASDPFLEALRRGVRSMENMPGRLKDWHPHTDETVLDLVDPSLFPIVYGTTRVLPNGTLPREDCVVLTGVGEVVQGVFLGRDRVTWLFNPDNLVGFGHYQWLPCDVTFDQNRQANIEGYINNLHPQRHAELYPVLAAAVDKAVPMWNATLSWNSSDRRCRIQVNRCDFRDFQRPDHIEEDDWPDDDFIHNHPEELRLIQPSVARRYKPPTKYPTNRRKKPFDLIKDFPTGLQIIFKLMNVHLTPEKPTYGGSDWRVEGTLNEHICATALFYYDQENIEDGHLEFRHRIDTEDMMCIAVSDEYLAAERLFGIKKDDPPLQCLPTVLTRSHRMLAFNNVMQHRVGPCSLRDRSRPGHRKILALFLVDPHVPILSTSHVPPQQRDWWAERVRQEGRFRDLPEELFQQVMGEVEDFPLSWERACEVREALTVEREGLKESLERRWCEGNVFFSEH